MGNKNEIIIDGVNVAECKHITNYENVLFVCQETGKKCEITKDCYFKQLKRLEKAYNELVQVYKIQIKK